jgi:hypothetical protein
MYCLIVESQVHQEVPNAARVHNNGEAGMWWGSSTGFVKVGEVLYACLVSMHCLLQTQMGNMLSMYWSHRAQAHFAGESFKLDPTSKAMKHETWLSRLQVSYMSFWIAEVKLALAGKCNGCSRTKVKT